MKGANAVLINITGGLDMTLLKLTKQPIEFAKRLIQMQPLFLVQHSMVSLTVLCVYQSLQLASTIMNKATAKRPPLQRETITIQCGTAFISNPLEALMLQAMI